MKKESYHHGNLKAMLIETGLKLISEENIDVLSLRKVAKICGVSNNAPYAHFKNKEEYINEMHEYINHKFIESLNECINASNMSVDTLIELGKSYVLFFKENPYYYHFLFSNNTNNTMFSLDILERKRDTPIGMFKEIAVTVLSDEGLSEYIIQNKVIAMWALVHGLANIVAMPNQTYKIDSEARIKEIIESLYILEA